MQSEIDKSADTGRHVYSKRMLWFVALWCAGFVGALLLALPFKLLVHAVTH